MLYGPYMTMDEIRAKYPKEWVFLAKPTKNSQGVTGGHVILHHPDRAEYLRLFDACPEIPDVDHYASDYTGEWSDFDELDVEPETGAA